LQVIGRALLFVSNHRIECDDFVGYLKAVLIKT